MEPTAASHDRERGARALASAGAVLVAYSGRAIAAAVGGAGAFVALEDAVFERSFHLFAATLSFGTLVVAIGLRRVERSAR